ncbi:MAG: aspartate aminotransferase family protein [Candidatus Sumerlaeaceae bacterium]|nr:aspartate aminotransferase family protein [Candidatus Sumerlaeaceae bacterium]
MAAKSGGLTTEQKYEKYVNTSFVKKIQPVVVDTAKGTWITAADGKRYLDCFAGISVVNAGHCNEEVVSAAKAQMDKVVHMCSYVYYNEPMADLAEKFAEITPGRLQKSFFSNSGAEAIEGAMRLARQFTKKTGFLALEGSFHGRTNATLSVTGNSARKKGGGPYMAGVYFAPTPYCYRCPFNTTPDKCQRECATAVERILLLHSWKDVAAFIAEPVQGEGGIVAPPEDYFKIVKEILDKEGILFICDEVQSGFGRTGKMFAIEHYGVEPDILTSAKGIADGFPLACFIARPDVADSFTPGDHLSTFGGNPISCAASLANIEVFEKTKLAEQSAKKGEFVMAKLRELADKHPLIGDVRGKGLMVGIELVKDRKTKEPAAAEAGKVQDLMRDAGVLIGVGGTYGNVIRFQPPLIISEDELTQAVEALGKALSQAV